MLIEIKRRKSNYLYTEGELYINDKKQTLTIESTETMLPAGTYLIRLSTNGHRKRVISIFTISSAYPSSFIGICHSWIDCKKENMVSIGEHLISGVLYNSTEIYNRIFERLEKCVNRGETINLEIQEQGMSESNVISHWLKS